MYTAVNTQDYDDHSESDMGDRESLYYDTISVASDATNRKSLSQSRLTIYHSAVDLAAGDTPTKSLNYRNNGNVYNQLSYAVGSGGSLPNRKSSLKQSCLQYHQQLQQSHPMMDFSTVENGGHALKDKLRQLFKDGHRTVDYVLAYNKQPSTDEQKEKRAVFEQNLMHEGLELEREETQKVCFVKIHAPIEVLCRYSEFLKLKLPLKTVKEQDQIVEPEFKLLGRLRSSFAWKAVQLDENLFPPPEHQLLHEYSRDRKDLFDCKNLKSSTNRIGIVSFILERQRFSNKGHNNYGIEKLLREGVYIDAYPLHDGQFFKPGNDRSLLLAEWGSAKQWLRLQPLDKIKDYFGAKIGLYFAWLGFYTTMLIPPSIVGVIGVIYGWSTVSTDKISNAICNDNNTILMCPQCDKKCDFWYLKQTCTSSKFNYVIDNNFTVFYALFMSIWAVLFLELWKRYSAKIIHRWGLTDFSSEVEHARPQYLERLINSKYRSKRFNADTNVLEPHPPFWRMKFPSFVLSYSIVILFICLAIITFCSLIVYRMAQRASRSVLSDEIMSSKILLLPLTSGIIDLIVIMSLDYIYSNYLAIFLTNLEYRRTEIEYQESLTIKNYLFQFFNYYSSLFYIAFLKGKFVGYPKKYNRIMGYRQEECNPGGCLMELSIQLAIIMIGKQILNEVLELSLPYIRKTISRVKNTMGLSRSEDEEKLHPHNQWAEDYHLLPWTNSSLFYEYLEMVLQFGFITIFGLAFPLAPLLALINNAFELRMDAMKLLKFYRRPIPQRANNIGVWYAIMSIVTKIAVASTAFIIAFSSNLIPKLVYTADKYINDLNLDGYLNWTLARFNTSDFQQPPINSIYQNITECRYSEFRNPPEDPHPYKRPMIYWKILVARLAFLVVFQNIVGMIQTIVAWAIPDTPLKLNDQIKREKLLIHETLMREEKKKIVEQASKTVVNGDPLTNTQSEIIHEYNVHPDGEIVRRRVYGRTPEEDSLYPLPEDRTSAV